MQSYPVPHRGQPRLSRRGSDHPRYTSSRPPTRSAVWSAAFSRKTASEAALAGHKAASEALAIIRAREAFADYRTGGRPMKITVSSRKSWGCRNTHPSAPRSS